MKMIFSKKNQDNCICKIAVEKSSVQKPSLIFKRWEGDSRWAFIHA